MLYESHSINLRCAYLVSGFQPLVILRVSYGSKLLNYILGRSLRNYGSTLKNG